MPQYWFFLTDPETYHLDALFRKGKDVWDGVYGANAQKHLAKVKKGDGILGYHTAPEKAVYAVLEAVSDAYPDRKENQSRDREGAGKDKTIYVVDVKGVRKLPRPVPLQALRDDPKLSEMAFLLIPRVAVSPLTAAQYQEILRLGSAK